MAINPKTEINEWDYMAIERLEEKAPKTLEERVQKLEDLREINDLLWRYAHLSDRPGFKERLVNDFCTEDVVKVHAGTLNQRFFGRQACLDGWKAGTLTTINGDNSKSGRPTPNSGTTNMSLPARQWQASHLNFPMIIRIADDGKTAWVAYYHWLNQARIENNELTFKGHTGTDTFWLTKQDRWRIKKWVVQTDIGFRSEVFEKPVRSLEKAKLVK